MARKTETAAQGRRMDEAAGSQGRTRVTMDITGLCGIWTGDVARGAGKELKVLMLKGMDDVRHRPVLTFNMRSFGSLAGHQAAPRPLEVVQLPSGEQIGSWELEGKVVKLGFQREATPGKVVLLGEKRPPSEHPRTPAEELGLHWMPSVGRACGREDARVHKRYLGVHPGKDGGGNGGTSDDKVIARFDLPQGFVYASASVNQLRDPDVWEFTCASGVVMRQFIAETIRCEISALPSSTVEIVAHPYGEPENKESLILKSWDEAIRMTLTNLPSVAAPSPDDFRHFMAYYDILDPVPDADSRSKPRKVSPAPRPSGPLVDDPSLSPGAVPPDEGDENVTALGVRPVMCSPGGYP